MRFREQPRLFLKIKELVDASPAKNQIWLTGSQKPNLMKHVGDTLSGRVVDVDVFPLSQSEKQHDPFRPSFFPSFDGNESALWNYTETIENIIQGGYPELYSLRKENRNAWFYSYVNTYLLGDIKSEIDEVDTLQFEKILRVLAARLGCTLNYSAISQEVGISVRNSIFTVKKEKEEKMKTRMLLKSILSKRQAINFIHSKSK